MCVKQHWQPHAALTLPVNKLTREMQKGMLGLGVKVAKHDYPALPTTKSVIADGLFCACSFSWFGGREYGPGLRAWDLLFVGGCSWVF